MNKIYCFIAILLLGFVTACNENEFLNEQPRDEIYADNLFETYDGFRLAVNALLDFPRQERMDIINSAETGTIWKIGVDNGWANTELSWTRGLNRYNVDLNPEMQFIDGGVNGSDGIFLQLYKCINSANMIIHRADNPDINWQGLSEQDSQNKKNQILGHAYLLRAWAYRHLVYTFGDIPISTEEIDGATFRNDWERRPVSEVQALIEEDLLLAEQYLPEHSEDVTVLNRVIAQHYLAELYLWMDNPAKAEEKALGAVNNPNYGLITNRYGVKKDQPGCAFMDQFYDGNILPSQGNTEALWVFPNNSSVVDYLGAYRNSMRRTWVINYYNYAPITPEHGGRGIGRCAITAWGLGIYEPGDDRFSEYAVRKYYTTSDGSIINTQSKESQMKVNNNKWASTRKWDWSFDDPNLYTNSFSYADQSYLRIADTYLLLAEAKMKLGKMTEAAEWINKIRRRANASEITSADVTLDFILDERSRELVTEEYRRETLVRTGKLVERTRLHNPIAAGTTYNTTGIQDEHVLLPIPLKVINANTGSVMEQNPGY